jgi:hypothetical protein
VHSAYQMAKVRLGPHKNLPAKWLWDPALQH